MNHNQLLLLIGLIVLTLGLARRFPGFALSRPISLLVSSGKEIPASVMISHMAGP